MNLKKASIIDEIIGTLCCFVLSIFNSIATSTKENCPDSETNTILLMKFWGMGSITLTSPAILALRKQYPQAHITFLTFTGNRDIIEALQLVDSIVEIDNKLIFSFLLSLPITFYRLRIRKFDLVIDFEFFTRFSAITSYLVCKRERVGFYDKRAYRGNLHTKKVPFNINAHVTENFCSLVRAVGVDCNPKRLVPLCIDKASDRYVEELLDTKGATPGDTVIVINVNASTLSLQRRWPRENYKEIIAVLADTGALKVILIGAEADFEYVQSLCKATRNSDCVINLAGKTTVLQLLSLLKRSRLLITNDSGPLHFAAALGVPTISFFGPETPVLYGPLGEGHTIFYKNIDCSPCIHAVNTKLTNCTNPICMDTITVDEVRRVIDTFLAQSKE